ncbi:hypothetical protein CHCC14821_3399 [Bacillus paralicheniformis]|nr:hypothetical protein CHCC14821_3399 [Bacillus paralicheniformis]
MILKIKCQILRKRWHHVDGAFCPAGIPFGELIDPQQTVENRLLIF